MQNYLVLIFSIILPFLSLNGLRAQAPVPVKRIIFEQKDPSFYLEQYHAWKRAIVNRKQDASAWMNYYTAAHYARRFNQNEAEHISLDEIVDGVKSALPNSFEALYLSYWKDNFTKGLDDFNLLQKAYEKDPNRSETYEAFIKKAVLSGDKKMFKKFIIKHFNSELHSPGFMHWNYNVLVNLDKNAVLFTHGDNDTYPAWKLQVVNGIRTDVTVINTSLLGLEAYQVEMAKVLGIPAFGLDLNEIRDYGKFELALVQHVIEHSRRPVYLGVGSSENLKAALRDSTYLVGLSLKYDTDALDNMPIIANSYDHLFHLDYLEYTFSPDPSQAALDKFSISYLPSMLKAYADKKTSGDKVGEAKMKKLILRIGEKTDSSDKVKSYLN